jgi:hypothetical protein
VNGPMPAEPAMADLPARVAGAHGPCIHP